MKRNAQARTLHRISEREMTQEELREEVKRLRRDCDAMSIQRSIDDLLVRVSALEARASGKH